MPMLEKYKVLRVLGDGTFGVVSLAKVVETGEMVAIKKMKQEFRSWEECLKLKEVQTLAKLKHVNIVKVHEIFRADNKLYFVFEYMKQNLYELLKSRGNKPYPEHIVRNIIYQILQAIFYMHCQGYFHRDLKPENILCQGPELIKLADFGQAREIRSCPPYTDYISTRWYRAPEVQLGSTHYNSPVDIWAIACIMSEVYTGRPLFPGSGTVDQVFKICAILGTPTKATWSEGVSLATAMSVRLPVMVPTPLGSLVPTAGHDGISIMKEMLHWDPRKRPTAGQVLKHKYFQTHVHIATSGQSTKNLVTTPEPSLRERGDKRQELDRVRERKTPLERGNFNMAVKEREQANDRLRQSNEQRKRWYDRNTNSQDSGVDSEVQQSNHSITLTRPQAPPTEPLAPPMYPLVPPFFTTAHKKVLRRKDTLPNIDNEDQSRRRQWVAMEMGKGDVIMKSIPRRLRQLEDDMLPWQPPKLLPVIDKREAANFYLRQSRYSPVVSGKSSKLGFGSSAPRFIEDTPSPPPPPLRPLGRVRGERGQIPHFGRNDAGMGQWNTTSQAGLFPTEVMRIKPAGERSLNIPPFLGSSALTRTDWSTRYNKRK